MLMLLLLQPLCVVKWSNHECLLRVFEGGGGGCLIHLLLHRWLWTLEKMVDILWTRSSSGWWVMLNSKPLKIQESLKSRGAHFKKISSDLAGWWIFRTIFHEDFKNVNFINVGHTPLTLNFCPRSPSSGSATGCEGRSLASTGFVWSKNQEGCFC